MSINHFTLGRLFAAATGLREAATGRNLALIFKCCFPPALFVIGMFLGRLFLDVCLLFSIASDGLISLGERSFIGCDWLVGMAGSIRVAVWTEREGALDLL